jgi:hypothetical protein
LTSKLKSYLPGNNNSDWLNGIAFLTCVWFIFFPYPFLELFCVLASIPILGSVFAFFLNIVSFNRLAKNEFDKNEGEQNAISLYIIYPSIVLAIRIYLKFECEN